MAAASKKMMKKRGAAYDPFMVVGGLIVVGAASFFLYITFLIPYGYMMHLETRFWQRIFAISFFVVASTVWIMHSDYITLTTIFNTVSKGGYGMEDAPKKVSIKPNLDELKGQIEDCIHKGNKDRVKELLTEVDAVYQSAEEEDKKKNKKYYLKIKNSAEKYLNPIDESKISLETKKKIEELEKLYKEGLFTEEELEEKKNMLLKR